MKTKLHLFRLRILAFVILHSTFGILHAQVPNLVSYQGRVAVSGVNFDSDTAGHPGLFKFALVNGTDNTLLWTNSPDTTPADGVPDDAVSLTVTKGLYSVLLGDTSLTNLTATPPSVMTAIPTTVWANADVRLRVWFNDGTPNGFQLLTPDQRLASSGYLPDGSVTEFKIGTGAVTNTKIGSQAVDTPQLMAGAVTNGKIANGAVGITKLGSGVGVWSVNGGNVYRSTGYVGIGVTNPASALDVAGIGNFSGGLTTGSITTATDFTVSTQPEYYGLNHTDGVRTLSTYVGEYGCYIGSYSNDPLHFYVNNDGAKMTVATSGNVGIGTITPISKLTVQTDTDNYGITHTDGNVTLSTYVDASGGWLGTYSNHPLNFFANALNRMTLLQNGNFGIGTTTPTERLTVQTATGNYGITHTDGSVVLSTYADASGGWLGTHSDHPLNFFANDGYQQITLLQNGNVGIGTATPTTKLQVSGEITCTAVNITSDRNAKEQFKPVNAREVLAKVARLPISEWQYKTQGDARHIGPMAQDFREAFALGHDEKHITSVDADGVALAAIQGLHEIVQDKDAELTRLKTENRALAERLTAIEQALGMRREARADDQKN